MDCRLGAALLFFAELAAAAPAPILVGSRPWSTRPLSAEEHEGAFAAAQPLFLVVDTPYEVWSDAGSYAHVAVYTRDFKPAAGAMVYVDETPVGVTDWRGALVFWHVPRAVESAAGAKTVTAVLSLGGKKAVGQTSFESYARTAGFASNQLFVYTDRGVYQPGQRLNLRFLAWSLKGDYTPISDRPIDIVLFDADGHFAGGGQVFTNRYGTGSFTIPLPPSLPPGRYELAVRFEAARAATWLRVETVRPPALLLEHDLPRYIGRDLAAWAVQISVSSFAGAEVKAGKVVVSLRHGDKLLEKLERDLAAGTRLTLAFSDATLAYLRKQVPSGERLLVELAGTDAYGRTDVVQRDVLVLDNPYRAVLEADKDTYLVGAIAKVQLKLTDVDGVGVPQKAAVLQTPQGPLERATDAQGIAVFEVRLDAPETEVQVKVPDVAQPLASTLLVALAGKPLGASLGVGLVQERKRVPIEVRFDPAYEPVDLSVHGDIVDSSGSLIGAFLLPIVKDGGQSVARGSFVAPSWGTMLLTLFCVARPKSAPAAPNSPANGSAGEPKAPVGLLTDGLQLTVTPDRNLAVTLSGLPKAGKPGQRLSLRGRVLDARGYGANAAVGVSVVDAAVLSLLEPMELRPGPRFYNPQLKVLASTGAKLLTWPVVSRNWGQAQIDLALPPFGFAPGDNGAPRPGRDVADHLRGGVQAAAAGPARASAAAPGAAPEVTGRAPAAAPAEARPSTAITLRTRFDETSLWLGDLEARWGGFGFDITLPEALTRQTFTVVASDAAGGLGTLVQELPVSQELFVRSDAPVRLRVGDRVTLNASAHNRTDKELAGTLALALKDPIALRADGPLSLPVTLPPQGSAHGSFVVSAQKAGRFTYELRLAVPGREDVERRELEIVPAGTPVVESIAGSVSRAAPFAAKVSGGVGTSVMLRLVLPQSGVAAELVEGLRGDAWGFGEAPGARAAAAFQLARALDKAGRLDNATALALRDRIAEDLVWLATHRDAGGGYRFWRSERPSPYLTARALDGLVAARETNFPVARELFAGAGESILATVDAEGLIGIADVAFWEGQSAARKLALSATAFRSLAEAGPEAVPEARKEALARLRAALEKALATTDDPLAVANIGLGLIAHAANFSQQPLDPALARRLLRRAIEARRNGRWEPAWFSGQGGTLEATALALELVHTLDPVQAQPLIAESLGVLLAARRTMAPWHGAAGLVALARAAAALPQESDPYPCSVSVEVDKKAVYRRPIGGPLDSEAAQALLRVELSSFVGDGEHEVVVKYSGKLAPKLWLETGHWLERGAGSLTAQRSFDSPPQLGAPVGVSLRVASAEPRDRVVLEEPLPLGAEVDEASLQALVRARQIAAYDLGPRLRLYVPRLEKPTTLRYRLVASRRGDASFGPTAAWTADRPEAGAVIGESSRWVVP